MSQNEENKDNNQNQLREPGRWMKEEQNRLNNNKQEEKSTAREDDQQTPSFTRNTVNDNSPTSHQLEQQQQDQVDDYVAYSSTTVAETIKREQELHKTLFPNLDKHHQSCGQNNNNNKKNHRYTCNRRYDDDSCPEHQRRQFECLESSFYLTSIECAFVAVVLIVMGFLMYKSYRSDSLDKYYRGWSAELRADIAVARDEVLRELLDAEAKLFMELMQLSQADFFERPAEFVEWVIARHPNVNHELLTCRIASAANRYFTQSMPSNPKKKSNNSNNNNNNDDDDASSHHSLDTYEQGAGAERNERIARRAERIKAKLLEEFNKEKEQRKPKMGQSDEDKNKMQKHDAAKEKEIERRAWKQAVHAPASPTNVFVAGFPGKV